MLVVVVNMVESAITTAIAAGKVPVGVTADYLMENRDAGSIGGMLAVAVLALLIVCARLYARLFFSVSSFGLDDSLIIFTAVIYITLIGLSIKLLKMDSGRHIEYIQYVMSNEVTNKTQVYDFVAHLIYTTALYVCRVSGLVFYKRLKGLSGELSVGKLANHIHSQLGFAILPIDVKLITKPEDLYQWSILTAGYSIGLETSRSDASKLASGDLLRNPLRSSNIMTWDFQEEMLLAYSDEDLAGYIRASPHHDSVSRVLILSTNLVAKVYRPDTVHTEDITRAMEMAQQLGVRIPCIKRILTFDGTTFYIIERIDGSTLNEAWTKLSWFTTIKLGLQLRRFIHLMRLATSPTAGSLASGECRSFYLEDRFGLPARSSPEVITYFIKFWSGFSSLQHAREAADHGEALGSKIHPNRFIPPTDTTLILTHHDLAPRNILLDYSGQLWLLDWDYAGWYPRYFESRRGMAAKSQGLQSLAGISGRWEFTFEKMHYNNVGLSTGNTVLNCADSALKVGTHDTYRNPWIITSPNRVYAVAMWNVSVVDTDSEKKDASALCHAEIATGIPSIARIENTMEGIVSNVSALHKAYRDSITELSNGVNTGRCPTCRKSIDLIDDKTVIATAAANGDTEKVRWQLENGIQLSPRDILDSTPLLRAAQHGH
ncbi:hypothetical protein V490_00111 [Pseudogymnoascus sp. VKM F-3557]|nr:hypothetical protein V490_00111 [Pseudogymnoascus sp. VKM F-3557]